MFGPAMFYDRSALSCLAVFSIAEWPYVLPLAHWDCCDCYRARDVRGTLVVFDLHTTLFSVWAWFYARFKVRPRISVSKALAETRGKASDREI